MPPLPKQAIEKIVTDFYRDGFALVPGALSDADVQQLRALADRCLDDPDGAGRGFVERVYGTPVLRNTQSLDPLFAELLVREPFTSLAERILGSGYGFCGQNVIRSRSGEAISTWHVDDELNFPLPADMPRHDARTRLPVLWFSFQIALSDILSPDDGATEVVPGSHYSGRVPPRHREEPDENDPPTFEGRGPLSILCRAGDAYVFNHQVWHRGGPNRSGRTRYLMQNQYGQAWLFRRFGAGSHRSCDLPPADAATLSEAAKRLLNTGSV
ncbi:MAG: phytanoyl-CoA dioxygenase family protein [Verrucomicrobia bacterium]|nr:phytanoyl-CoA dioxygenase family protein [Verrucomicrobiota bacterium]